jgi:hypothetical protein
MIVGMLRHRRFIVIDVEDPPSLFDVHDVGLLKGSLATVCGFGTIVTRRFAIPPV